MVIPASLRAHSLRCSIANVLFAVSPKDVDYWRLPFNAMWMAVLGADLYVLPQPQEAQTDTSA